MVNSRRLQFSLTNWKENLKEESQSSIWITSSILGRNGTHHYLWIPYQRSRRSGTNAHHSPIFSTKFSWFENKDPNTFLFNIEVLCREYYYSTNAQILKVFPLTLKGADLWRFMSLGINCIQTWKTWSMYSWINTKTNTNPMDIFLVWYKGKLKFWKTMRSDFDMTFKNQCINKWQKRHWKHSYSKELETNL